MAKLDLARLLKNVGVRNQYARQMARVHARGDQTRLIDGAVRGVMKKLPRARTASLVVYGEPQSGKTEMMICLTARLLDAGHRTIIHLMNDSVDLMRQNLDRFQLAGLAPAPRTVGELVESPLVPGHSCVVFCKKNALDLTKLIAATRSSRPILVIDDEADYATPNAKVNQRVKTRINQLVSQLLTGGGKYIGVTATPARLNLNNTFDNRTESWVRFRPHKRYTGQNEFFPLRGSMPYRLRLVAAASPSVARTALARFLVTVAHLNTRALAADKPEGNYSILVHTSGNTIDHARDRQLFETAMHALIGRSGSLFLKMAGLVHREAKRLYPKDDPDVLTTYVIANASRSSSVVLNSKRDRKVAGDRPTVPTTPFTLIIGGNIVSRGVTFPDLLAMYFMRDVKTKLQQDTYIQRARMFGTRGHYLRHFELTIPTGLYADWHRCFVFHRLALNAVENNALSPVWVGDPRISIASSSSIDRGTVDLNRGEMSFQMFRCLRPARLDAVVAKDPYSLDTLRELAELIGPALPQFLIDYIEMALIIAPGTLAIHTSSNISGYGRSADVAKIARKKGFLGEPQLERRRFPVATHHIKVLLNRKRNARVFYKNEAGVQFVQNLVS